MQKKGPQLDFLYFDAGGGHRSAAMALDAVIAAENRGWNVQLINLQEVLDPLDIFRKATGVRLQDIYNLVLARGWTLGSRYLLPLMHGIIRLYHPSQVRLLTEFWRRRNPDMVVSLVPNFNRAAFKSLQTVWPQVPFVTILTDLADYPPHFWMEHQPQDFICGTSHAVQQALQMGHAPARVHAVSGMILRPDFYQPLDIERGRERERLGLRADVPTGLVLFGGEGSNVMHTIAQRLGQTKRELQLIFICGRNAQLRARLSALKIRNRIFVEGFTRQVPYYMRLADFFIGKPGPGSICEALQMNLPVIVEQNAWTLPQENFNANWVRQKKVGVVLGNFRDIEAATDLILREDYFRALQERISKLDNRAVFEIPGILERILQRRPAAAA